MRHAKTTDFANAANFDNLITAHAVAFNKFGDASSRAEAKTAKAFKAAEAALCTTRAARPRDTAYKLTAAWIGRHPDFPNLNHATAIDILASEDTSADDKLIASAFMDLYDSDLAMHPLTPPAGLDGAALAYRAARDKMCAFAHGLDPSRGLAHEHDVDDDPAADRMLATPPVGLAGISERLGRIISMAFIHKAGDWDCPHCISDRQAIIAPSSEELCGAGEGQNGGEAALFMALANLHLQVEALVAELHNHQRAPATFSGELTPLAFKWGAAKERYFTAKALDEAAEGAERDDGREVFDALEAWESLPPPSLAAMVEVWGEAMNFLGLDYGFQDVNDPRTIRDFLDGGDTHEIFAARYYQHALRLAGISSGALSTPSVAGLYPAVNTAGVFGAAVHPAYDEHHREAELYPSRRQHLIDWWGAVLSDPTTKAQQDIVGSDNVGAAWDSQGFGPDRLAAE